MDDNEELAYHVQQSVREFGLAMQAKSRAARLAHLKLVAEHSAAAQMIRVDLEKKQTSDAGERHLDGC